MRGDAFVNRCMRGITQTQSAALRAGTKAIANEDSKRYKCLKAVVEDRDRQNRLTEIYWAQVRAGRSSHRKAFPDHAEEV